MAMDISTFGIITHPPTYDELHDCHWIILSDEYDWDPSKNLFKIYSVEEEYRTISNFHCYINIVESRIPSAPPTIQWRDESEIHKFDITVANISIGLDQALLVDRLIINIRVMRTRRGYVTYTDKPHHGISADILARIWGIGLDKAKRTLQSTTQDNVRSALKPLARWYITDLLSQRLHWLNFRFYKDIILEKDKSIVGNTCAQIFIERDFSNNSYEV